MALPPTPLLRKHSGPGLLTEAQPGLLLLVLCANLSEKTSPWMALPLVALMGCGTGRRWKAAFYYGPWQCNRRWMDSCRMECAGQGYALKGCMWLADMKMDWNGLSPITDAESSPARAVEESKVSTQLDHREHDVADSPSRAIDAVKDSHAESVASNQMKRLLNSERSASTGTWGNRIPLGTAIQIDHQNRVVSCLRTELGGAREGVQPIGGSDESIVGEVSSGEVIGVWGRREVHRKICDGRKGSGSKIGSLQMGDSRCAAIADVTGAARGR